MDEDTVLIQDVAIQDVAMCDGIPCVPETRCGLTNVQHRGLIQQIDPLRESDCLGVDIYADTLRYIQETS